MKRTSHAWLAYDQDALYIAVDNDVHPDSDLDGNAWGQDDAVEIGLRVERKEKPAPIAVLRGFANGFLRFGCVPVGDSEPKAMEPGPITFKAQVPEPGRWTAEFRIPFEMFEFDPATDRRVAFNLTVRKAKGDHWVMWQGTGGYSYDVVQAGIIEIG